MEIFYRGAFGDAVGESEQMAKRHKKLHAQLLALSGQQREKLRSRRLYHFDVDRNQSLFFDACSVGNAKGYIFFSKAPARRPQWLILMMGEGTATDAVCVEVMKRFNN